MPSYRTNLTLISSLLLVIAPVAVSAVPHDPLPGSVSVEAAVVGGANLRDPIASEGVPLRKTSRLGVSSLNAGVFVSALSDAGDPVERSPQTPSDGVVRAAETSVPSSGSVRAVERSAASGSTVVVEALTLADPLARQPVQFAATLRGQLASAPVAASQTVPAQTSFASLVDAVPVKPSADQALAEIGKLAAVSPKTPVAESPMVSSLVEVPSAKENAEAEKIILSGVPPLVLASAAVSPVSTDGPATAVLKGWVLSKEDRTIRNSLERWSQDANWQLAWEYPGDFQIEFDARFDGDFIDATSRVVDGLSRPDRPIRAEFYFGNRVLRIVSGRE